MALKRLTRLALLTALCIVLREAFSSLPNIQPITAIFLVVTIAYGLWDGIFLSSLTMVLTGFLIGFGEVVARQMLVFALLCIIWYFSYPFLKQLPFKLSASLQIIVVACLSILYGILLDIGSAYIYNVPVWTYILNGIYFNFLHAISTALFYPIILTIFRRLPHEKNID
ncbi:ECF transporter S component [Streptococcus dentapri]|uniref:ECF transporter S component n=1 Tax=Streptococcus dentapri TaxID=573564 RepID=A0ABV8CZ08_9STRE